MEEDLLKGPENDQPSRDVIIIFAVFVELGLAPFSLFLGWLLGYHNPLAKFEWTLASAVWGAIAALPLVAFSIVSLTWPVGPLARIKRFCDQEVVPLLANSSWSELALISVSAGVCEEMLFRGVLQAAFSDWWGPIWGILIASILFGLIHPFSLRVIVVNMFLGMYFGVICFYNGNLLSVIVTHTLYDFGALGFLIRYYARDDDPETLEPN